MYCAGLGSMVEEPDPALEAFVESFSAMYMSDIGHLQEVIGTLAAAPQEADDERELTVRKS